MSFRFPVAPSLREFVYHALYSLGEQGGFKLKDSYRQLGRTNSRAKKFCDRATLEQINHILGMLGIQWFTVYFDDPTKPQNVRQLFEDYKIKGWANTELARLVKDKIYVTTDKQFIHYLGDVSSGIDSAEYRRSMELARAGWHFRKWKKLLNSPTAIQDEEDSQSMVYLGRMVIATFLTGKQFSLTENDSLILFYVYTYRNSYVLSTMVDKEFLGMYKSNKIRYSLRRLTETKLIQKHIDPSKKAYQVTALGIAMVNKMLGGILKNINF